MDLAFEGDGQGSGNYFFAHKKGMLLGGNGTHTMEATVAISGAQNMTMPMVQEMMWELNVVR